MQTFYQTMMSLSFRQHPLIRASEGSRRSTTKQRLNVMTWKRR